jgi:putative MATE family efflux protein
MSDPTLVKEKTRDKASEIITSGRISTAVWFVAWPTIINTLIHTAYNLINRAFLGHTSGDTSSALAAIGIGMVVLMVQSAVVFGISTGASALASRFLGAGQMSDAEEATGQSLVLATAAAILTAIPIVIYTVPIVTLAGAHGKVIPLAADYLRILAIFASVPPFLRMTIQSALRSAGDTKSPLYVGAVLVAVNILLDWLLIFGTAPVSLPIVGWQIPAIPPMGVRGAAIATSISHMVGLMLILVFLHRSVLGRSLRHLKPHPQWFVRIMAIGLPAIMHNLLWSVAFAAFVKVIGLLPNATDAQAALTVAITIEMLAFMPGVAYSMAATPLVGQNLGAEKPKRAEHSAWVATGQAVAIMSAVGIIFLIIPAQIARLFTKEHSVVQHMVTYLRINGAAEPFLALAMVLTGALHGAGDTLFPMLIETITSVIVRLSLTWLLAIHLGYGVTGAWIAMAASTALYGVLVTLWFRKGNWKHRQV